MTDSPPRIDTLQSIELAEGVEIRLRIAGPYVRSFAYAIDLMIQLGIFIGLAMITSVVGIALGQNVGQGVLLLGMFILHWFYQILFEAGKKGASPGKRAMGLRVVDQSGIPISFGQSFLRNMLRGVDALPGFYGIGLFSCFASKKFQRLGDMAANTLVIYERPFTQRVSALPPALEAIAPTMPLEREEQAAILDFKNRAGQWSEARQLELSDHASELTKSEGREGLAKLLAIAKWLNDRK
ncbi:RDD family protein [Persicirhabdus sediminis]|uniref:RDD family protein n=1 Tax=Persicirhabdus sediminis TaxID=454144 RepID=A0A8J7MBJ6_9BACT|nr:RDD family protein [Persicirhabdus sediminis]MBK1789553.1 RDD family protein [Persicirhabdus sediminis]